MFASNTADEATTTDFTTRLESPQHVEQLAPGRQARFALDQFANVVYAQKPWMTDFLEQPSLYFVHQDQVIELPPEAELLGGNEFCPNLFYTIGNQVLGIQGHPEFPKTLIQEIIESRELVVGQALQVEALRSLEEGEPDNQLFAEWIVNFLVS